MKKLIAGLLCTMFIVNSTLSACTLYNSPTFNPDINITPPSDYNGTI